MNSINKKILLFLSLFLFTNISLVKAECTEEELNELKQQAENIEITYEHMGKITEEEIVITNKFKVTIENIPNDLIIDHVIEGKITPKNGITTMYLYTGNNTLDFYSNKCKQTIYSQTFKLPKYNQYYEDPLCEGIDGDEFALCGKYYDYDVEYNDFELRVKNYRITHKIDEKIKNEKKLLEEEKNKSIIEKVLDYTIKYKKNLLILSGIIILLIILIILIKRKKKRGVLQ